MWKKLISMILVIAFFSFFILSTAEAGSKQRQMWKGAGIALGAVALGSIAYHLMTHTHPTPPPPVVYCPPPPPPVVYCPPPPDYTPGHWEITREWIPERWEKVWIPGYYNSRGHWVEGHYEDHKIPGHYEERRVWVEGRYRCN